MFISEKLETKIADSCDVLVCGGGIAGISAALAAARLGEGKGVKRGDICLLLFAWAATLPICFSLGFLISKLIFVIIL